MDNSSSGMINNPPGDHALIADIVNYIKSEGIFDEMRRECLSDVDTKPAFQNLKQRVEGFSSNFLAKIRWRPDLNKNQLRDKLRSELNNSGMMALGLDHLVDQVVSQKASRSFMPRIREVFYNYSGFKKPEGSQPAPGFPFNVPPPFVSKNRVFRPPESLQAKRRNEQALRAEASSSFISLEEKTLKPDNDRKKETELLLSDSSSSSFDKVAGRHENKSNVKRIGNVGESNNCHRKSADAIGVETKITTKYEPQKGESVENREKEGAKSSDGKLHTDSFRQNSGDENLSPFDRLLKSGNLIANCSPKSTGAPKEHFKYHNDHEPSKSLDCSKVKSSLKYIQSKSEESDSEKMPSACSTKDISDSKSDRSDSSDRLKNKRQKLKYIENVRKEKLRSKPSEKSTFFKVPSDSSDSEFSTSSPSKMPNIENFQIFSYNKKCNPEMDSQKSYFSSCSEICDDEYESKAQKNGDKIHKDITPSSKIQIRTSGSSVDSSTQDSEAKEHSSEGPVDSKKIGLRRKRKINPKYTSNEFSSIFTKQKSKNDAIKSKKIDFADPKPSSSGNMDGKKSAEENHPLSFDSTACSSSSSDETSENLSSDTQETGDSTNGSDKNSDSCYKQIRCSTQSNVASTQRYTSCELYKPRPLIPSKRRSNKRKDSENGSREMKDLKRKRAHLFEDSPERSSKKKHLS